MCSLSGSRDKISIFCDFSEKSDKVSKIVAPPSLKIIAICWAFLNRYFMVLNGR